MAKKRKKINLKFTIDAPVTIAFAVLSVVLYLFEAVILKGKLPKALLASPTTIAGNVPFIVSSFPSYLRLFFYAFGAENWGALFANVLFVVLLGPAMEERYGSIVIGIMMAVSTLFAGVLNACFCPVSLRGCESIIFMMFFLNSFMSFSKKKVPVSFLLIFALYIARVVMENPSQIIGMIICIAGGLCGSLFAFLTSPKAKATRKADKESSFVKDDKEAYLEELDSQSPRFKKNNRRDDDDDETTVVGTLKF